MSVRGFFMSWAIKGAGVLVGVCAASGLVAGRASAAEKLQPANDLTIRMSPYEVSAASVDFKRWIKVSSPNYIVYTDADAKETNVVVRELEMMHLAAQSFFRRRVLNVPPTIVVLPTTGSDWRKIESKGSVKWKAAVSQPGEQLVNLIVVQYDWQDESIWIVRAPQARVLLNAMNLEGPFWFERGVSKFFETAEFTAEAVVLGRQNSRVRALSHNGWLAWDRFFKIDVGSKEFVDEFEVDRLEGQCAAFVQFMLANPEPAWFERVIEWAALQEADREPTDAEFTRVFGQDFKAWQKTMEAYMRGGKYHVTTVRMPPQTMNFVPVKIDLPVREMRELFVLTQILNQNVPASDESLAALLGRGLKTESLRELLAEACFKRGRHEAGMEQVRALLAGGTVNPAVPMMLAGERFQRAMRKPSIQARFTTAEAAELRTLVERALTIEPRHRMANAALAWVEALSPAVDGGTVERIEKIYRRLADHTTTADVLSALTVARWRAGQKDGARAVAEALRDSPFTDKEAREIAAQVLTALR